MIDLLEHLKTALVGRCALQRRHAHRVSMLALLLALGPAAALAQDTTIISGRVAGDDGAPLAYATVSVDALHLDARSRLDGRYTLRVPRAQVRGDSVTVTARLISRRAQTRVVVLAGAAVTLDFVLPALPIALSEVVVTGAGTTEIREKLGSVANTVSGDEIEQSHESNVVNALAGKAPGVVVTSQSGDPGAGAAIFIRGRNTIEGSGQPLFVVDGTPIDNSTTPTDYAAAGTVYTNRAADVDPHDIASVEILKGPAAATIYGTRASQGVVLITTKNGETGPPRVTLRSSFAWDDVSRRLPLQRSFGQGIDDSPATCDAPGCTPPSGSWGARLPAGTATYDHFGEVFHEGHTADIGLELSGGNVRRTYFLSVGRLAQRGIIVGPHSWYDRTTVRLKASQRMLSDRLRVTGNIAYTDARGNFIQKGDNRDGLMLAATRTPPDFDNLPYLDPATGQHRSYRYPSPAALTDDRIYDNPFWITDRLRNTSDVQRVFGNLTVDWDLSSWLRVQYLLGLDSWSEDRLEGFPPSSTKDPTGTLTQGSYDNRELDHNLHVILSRSIGHDIDASLTLGQNLNSRHFHDRHVTGTGFLAPDVFTLENVLATVPDSVETMEHTQAYFVQGSVDLFDQLFLTGALRDEGSSTFGSGHRHSLFPKASAAWTFTKLLPARSHALPSYGRLRVAYGETGRAPYPYQILTGYDDATTGDSRGLVTGGERAHPELGPERTREIEVGTDVGFLDRRVDAGVTYYHSRTVDAIFSVPVALSSGYVTQVQNSAAISNAGWEVTIDLHPVRTDDLDWQLGFQWARDRNRVERLDGADGTPLAEGIAFNDGFVNNPHSVIPGYPLGMLTGTDFVRCRYGEANLQNTSLGQRTDVNAICRAANAGESALFIDADGFPILDPALHVLADPNPKWTGSVRMSLTVLRRWRLSALLDVRHGGAVWNGTKGALVFFGTHKDTEQRATCTVDGCVGNEHVFGTDILPGAVVGPGVGKAVPIGQNWYHDGAGNLFNGGAVTPFIEDGGFAKLRVVEIDYTLDDAFVRHTLGLQSFDLSLAGRNLHTWTRYSGLDPETNVAGSAVIGQGIDYFVNPQSRSLVLTVVLRR